jgi:hypothetical protein
MPDSAGSRLKRTLLNINWNKNTNSVFHPQLQDVNKPSNSLSSDITSLNFHTDASCMADSCKLSALGNKRKQQGSSKYI